ncbi:MAG TPA: hypothetical protein VGU20_17080 [Stellaceae bacterium]|nr:hypothetical protein [Stellaceae bacterium]
MHIRRSSFHDIAAVALVLAALAVPVMHLVSDAARMHIKFRTAEMAKPHTFTTDTSRSTCTLMAAALAYENPETGAFTQVDCGE